MCDLSIFDNLFFFFSLSGTLDEMTLERSLDEAKLAVHYFFDNKFEEAKKLLEPW